MLRGEVNPCGVAVAKASLNRALPSAVLAVGGVVAGCRPEAE
jgi:hypothetical protein